MKTAIATTNLLPGTMILKVTITHETLPLPCAQVKQDGSTFVRKVSFTNPEKVQVQEYGNLRGENIGNYVKNSIRRIKPAVAEKIVRAARAMLRHV